MSKSISYVVIGVIAILAAVAGFQWFSLSQDNAALREQNMITLTRVKREAQAVIAEKDAIIAASKKREEVLLKEFAEAMTRYAHSSEAETEIIKEYEDALNAVLASDTVAINRILSGQR